MTRATALTAATALAAATAAEPAAARPRSARRATRALVGLAGLVGLVGCLAGCGVLPPLPEAVPTSLEATPSMSAAAGTDATPAAVGTLSPDGFDAAQRMAVRIRNVGCGSLSTGSGFAIDDHTLVTNRHVVADSASLEISTYDGRDVQAQAASTTPIADLALVRTVDPLPAAAGLAPTDPQRGASVTVAGYPLGSRLTLTRGNVIGATTDPLHDNLGEVLVTDAVVEPGSSGSAVLDAQGRVVGVVYAKGEDGTSFVVPVSTLRAMLDDEAEVTPAPTCTQ
ncbi:S1C family serine protease [Cellulomonas sp. DKR-3]|uniref:S1C family serine protease n=1 Tax=Cellulomonas fulva TaxID=2835530 RepID=A0ABS5U387_9CELL|nr:S1C family serine protease [Cellulomonas fulva]